MQYCNNIFVGFEHAQKHSLNELLKSYVDDAIP